MELRIVVATMVVLVISMAAPGVADDVTWTFEDKEVVELSTVAGDCIVEQGDGNIIEVRVEDDYTPDGCMEAKSSERGNKVKLEEDLNCRESHGGAVWTLIVPKGTRIEFSTASGDLVATEFDGDIDVSSASGDVELNACHGEFHFSTASGDVELSESEGDFWVSTASGDIAVKDCDGEFELSSASGDIDAPKSILRQQRNVHDRFDGDYD